MNDAPLTRYAWETDESRELSEQRDQAREHPHWFRRSHGRRGLLAELTAALQFQRYKRSFEPKREVEE